MSMDTRLNARTRQWMTTPKRPIDWSWFPIFVARCVTNPQRYMRMFFALPPPPEPGTLPTR